MWPSLTRARWRAAQARSWTSWRSRSRMAGCAAAVSARMASPAVDRFVGSALPILHWHIRLPVCVRSPHPLRAVIHRPAQGDAARTPRCGPMCRAVRWSTDDESIFLQRVCVSVGQACESCLAPAPSSVGSADGSRVASYGCLLTDGVKANVHRGSVVSFRFSVAKPARQVRVHCLSAVRTFHCSVAFQAKMMVWYWPRLLHFNPPPPPPPVHPSPSLHL